MYRLKPCPFCGNETIRIEMHRNSDPGAGVYMYEVVCDKCGASICGRSVDVFREKADAKQEAIKAWNRRAE